MAVQAAKGSPQGGNPADDPFLAFNFMIETGGLIRGGFHECSGLDATIDVVEYREGGQNTTTKKMPGQTKFSNLVFKRGMYSDMDFFNWLKDSIEGPPKRINGSVLLFDRQGNEVARWDFF